MSADTGVTVEATLEQAAVALPLVVTKSYGWWRMVVGEVMVDPPGDI